MKANRWAVSVGLALVVALCLSAPAAELADGRYYLFFDNAVPSLDHEYVASFVFCLERDGGAWAPIFSGIGHRIPFGLVRHDKADGDFVELDCLMLYFGEGREKSFKQNPEGSFLVNYTLRVALETQTKVGGTWRSSMPLPHRIPPAHQKPFPSTSEGALTGMFVPARRTGRTPAALGEHPRFLFRKDDLAVLKQKMTTDWGKSMMARMNKEDWSRSNSAVGLGLLYRLTGNREYADRAREFIMDDIDSGWWLPISGIHDPAWKAMEGVYAYDLVHETCDAAFHAKMRRTMRPNMHFLHNFCNIDRGNGASHSNWSAQYQTGVAMCALALLADPEPDRKEPSPLEIVKLSPPDDLEIKPGTPVLPRGGTRQILKWLAAGPFDLGVGNDGLAALGGIAKARPTDGATFKLKVKPEPSPESNDGLSRIEYKNAKVPTSSVRGYDLKPLTKEIIGRFFNISAGVKDDAAGKAAPDKKKAAGKGVTDDLLDDLLLSDEERLAAGAAAKKAVAKRPAWEVDRNRYQAGPGHKGLIDLREAMGRRCWRTIYFYAVLDNPRPCYVKVQMQNQQRWDPCVYIAGRRFEKNDILFMEAGKYPVMIPWTMTTYVHSHGRDEQDIDFVLAEVSQEEVDSLKKHHQAVNGFRKACRETLAARRSEGVSQDYEALMWLAHSRFVMDRWCSEAVGDRGWLIAGECYGRISLVTAMPFAHAYRNATGVDHARKPNLGWVVPQAVCRTVFASDQAVMHSYGRGGGPLGVDLYARGFGFVPDGLKPMALWGWKRTRTLADAGKLKAPELVVDKLDPMSAAFAFVNWPAADGNGMKEKNPAKCVPRVVTDTQVLGYTFRNRWKDGDDIVALLAGFRHSGGDWPGGYHGELRLLGLGAQWLVHAGWHPRSWPGMLPLEPLFKEVRERDRQTGEDGSGMVTLDFLDERKEVRGTRHFAVDYSGKCGAPALFVTVDRVPAPPTARVKEAREAYKKTIESIPPPKAKVSIELDASDGDSDLDNLLGGKSDKSHKSETMSEAGKKIAAEAEFDLMKNSMNRWILCTVEENRIEIAKNRFTIAAPNGATLTGTVVGPADPKMWQGEFEIGHEINYWRDHRGANFKRRVLQIGGGEFSFVIMTLQRGAAPEVKMSGAGPAAKAVIGDCTVSFNDDRIVLSKK